MPVSDANSRASGPSPLSEALRRTRSAFATVGLFSFFINVLMLAGPLYMLQVYDRVLNSGHVETLVMLTLMLAFAYMTLAALETLRTAVTIRIGAWLNSALSPAYIDSGIRARLAGQGGGSQAFRDISTLQGFVATQGMTAFLDMPWTPLFVGIIWVLHPALGMLAIGSTALLLTLSVLNEALTRGLLREANTKQMASYKLAEAATDNAESVRAMGMSGAITERWRLLNAEVQHVLMRASERSSYITGSAKFIRLFTQSLVLGVGSYLVLRGEATPGVMIASSILLGRALAPVDMAITAWKNFSGARLAYARLQKQAEAFPPEPRRMSLPAPRGGLSVRNLTTFGPNGPVLRQVSFDIEPGEVVAVIGPSAAGKSTLSRYLVGLVVPENGSVRLDGTDVSHWNSEELGQHIGYLPQDVGLFAGTIRDNIGRMTNAPDDMIVEAASLAHAHEMISHFPNGYETMLGDRGAGLSGGQRQRIGLARAVLGKPPLVVLDEPNANLDQAGEAALAAAILELKNSGSTVLVIGHRPSTLAQSDKVLLLNQGIVEAFGARAEVLQKMREATAARAVAESPGRAPAELESTAPEQAGSGHPHKFASEQPQDSRMRDVAQPVRDAVADPVARTATGLQS